MIRFSCPGCGAVYSVTDDKAGKTGKCPKCQTPFTIPAAEAPAPVAPPPPPPPPVSSNPFADLGEDGGVKKKKSPSKADLDDDDDRPRKKKTPSKADLDDEDDRPKKKPARRDEDEEDDRPKKKSRRDEEEEDELPKKKPARRDEDEEDDRPRKKGRRDEEDEDDFDDRPKKKPARAADLDDDEDDRPKKKSARRDDDEDDYDDRPRKKRGRRDDDDYDDDYDRPKKKKSSGLLLTAAILHIIAAVLYIPCGIAGLVGGSLMSLGGDATSNTAKFGGTTIKQSNKGGMTDADFKEAMKGFETLDKIGSEAKSVGTVFQILALLALIGGIVAIPAAVAGFTKKKWFVFVSIGAGGMFVLMVLIRVITSFMYILLSLTIFDIFLMATIPLGYGITVIWAALNKNVKKVLT